MNLDVRLADGVLAPLLKAPAGVTRPLHGWATTYGQIDDQGRVIPTEDRDRQTMDAARTLGGIDWSQYVGGGLWTDKHDRPHVFVGVPSSLSFHDVDSPLAKASGKIGWYTTGHLFDRDDPSSWEDHTSYVPTEKDLQQADHYWSLATDILKGIPRGLGFSVDGTCVLSPCRRRILKASVQHLAVCETPVNPDATAAVQAIRPDMIGADPCARCRCAEPCSLALRKARLTAPDTAEVAPEPPPWPVYTDSDLRRAKSAIQWVRAVRGGTLADAVSTIRQHLPRNS